MSENARAAVCSAQIQLFQRAPFQGGIIPLKSPVLQQEKKIIAVQAGNIMQGQMVLLSTSSS